MYTIVNYDVQMRKTHSVGVSRVVGDDARHGGRGLAGDGHSGQWAAGAAPAWQGLSWVLLMTVTMAGVGG